MGPILFCNAVEPTQGIVYALVASDHPETVRYVGQTTGEPLARLYGHQIERPNSRRNAAKFSWFEEVKARGAKVGMRVLGVYPKVELNQRERQWILFFLPSGLLTNRALPFVQWPRR